MLDFIRDWGWCLPLAVCGWVGVASGVAYWRSKQRVVLTTSVASLFAAGLLLRNGQGHHSTTEWFPELFRVYIGLMFLVIGATANPEFIAPYRSGYDILLFRRPQVQSLPRQRTLVWSVALASSILALFGFGLQTCGWADIPLNHSGCVRAIDFDEIVTNLAWTPDSQSLVLSLTSLDTNRIAAVWNIGKGQIDHRIPGERENGYPYIAVAPDGRTLAIEQEDDGTSMIMFWSLKDSRLQRTITLTNAYEHIHEIAWSSDGRWLAVPRNEGIAIVQASDGTVARSIPTISSTFAWMADDQIVIQPLADRLEWRRISDGATVQQVAIAGLATRLRASTDGNVLAMHVYAETEDVSRVQVWRANNPAIIDIPTANFEPEGIALSADGTLLAVGSQTDNATYTRLYIWRIVDGQMLAEWREGEYANNSTIVFSPDGRFIAYDNGSGNIFVRRTPIQ